MEKLINMSIYPKIIELLDSHSIEYKASEHEIVRTSKEAAAIRGVDIASGAKAMVIRSSGIFYMFYISAAEKVDLKAIKKIISAKSVSLATPEEVLDKTGCVVGCVAPFGNSLFGLKTYVDETLLQQPIINFSAGELTRSIQMKLEDWIKIEKPIKEKYSKK